MTTSTGLSARPRPPPPLAPLGPPALTPPARAPEHAAPPHPAGVRRAMPERRRQSRRRAVERYAAWAAGAASAAAFERERLELEGPATLLLATDGFYRLVDVYAAYSVDSLLKAASLLGLAELGRELRQIERADPNCRAHPRLKPMDDATAVLIAIDTDGEGSGPG